MSRRMTTVQLEVPLEMLNKKWSIAYLDGITTHYFNVKASHIHPIVPPKAFMTIAKGVEKGTENWITGDLTSGGKIKVKGNTIEVEPGTICCLTGLVDKYGSEIYEHDMVYLPDEEEPAEVLWDSDTASYRLVLEDATLSFDNYWASELEICGNSIKEARAAEEELEK